ncbi:MAG: DUF547 domain-containing protein [Congregibacter sp.]
MLEKRCVLSLCLGSMLLLSGGCGFIERLAIPDKKLIAKSLAQSGSESSVDHTAWDRFLQRYTLIDSEGVVRVDYASVTSASHKSLKDYIAELSAVDPARLTKNAQLAYWANLYNVKTVDVILDHYPVATIRNVKDGVFDLGPWEEKRLVVSELPLSLHDIEHGIVRPIWSTTPEVHYILNCAALGCPNLPQKAFTAHNVQELMRQAAVVYVNDAQRGVLTDDAGRVTLSKIYSWYRDDFGGSDASILNHLRSYAAPGLKSRLEGTEKIHEYTYNWSLNDKGS